jgi:hypothetical protein
MKKMICLICGKDGADSVDHVPPKGIFLVKSSDLITVPAHVSCNKSSELDDECFRLAITTMALQHSQDAENLFDGKIIRRLQEPKKSGQNRTKGKTATNAKQLLKGKMY